MPDINTPSLGLQEPTVNADKGAWGGILNSNLGLIDDAIAGVATVDLTGLTSYTLSATAGAPNQARKKFWIFTGALTADCTVTVPAVVRSSVFAQNSTSGGHNVILTTGSGTVLTLPSGSGSANVYCDGTNLVRFSVSASSVQSDGVADGGNQFRAIGGGYGAILRNDSVNTFLLVTASGSPYGTWNTLRPFAFNNASGAVTVDGSGAGTTFGGDIAAPVAFSNSLAALGHQRFPGTFSMRWGQSQADVNGNFTVNYDIPFGITVLNVVATPFGQTITAPIAVSVSGQNKTGFFGFTCSGSGKIGLAVFNWQALGF